MIALPLSQGRGGRRGRQGGGHHLPDGLVGTRPFFRGDGQEGRGQNRTSKCDEGMSRGCELVRLRHGYVDVMITGQGTGR